KVDPFLQVYVPGRSGNSPGFTIRGFGTASFGGGSPVAQVVNGFRVPSGAFDSDLDDKERIEVVTGVTGFLTGENAPGGMINYVSKRPTDDFVNDVTIGDYGGGNAFIHGDFGGQIPDTRIGYRLNVVEQGGPTEEDQQSIERQVFAAALDFHLSDS